MHEIIPPSRPHPAAADTSPLAAADLAPALPVVGRLTPRAGLDVFKPGEDGSSKASPRGIETLTRGMARGDEAAFREFYDAYYDRLLRYLLVVTGGNEEASREALQLALVRVVRHIKPFDAEEKFWSWLTVLARSARADESRKQRRYFAFLERFTRHVEVADAGGSNRAADERLGELLERNVSSLPPEERELIAQKYYLRRSVREIAGSQQVTEKAVESRLSRIRRKLKDAVYAGLKNEQPL